MDNRYIEELKKNLENKYGDINFRFLDENSNINDAVNSSDREKVLFIWTSKKIYPYKLLEIRKFMLSKMSERKYNIVVISEEELENPEDGITKIENKLGDWVIKDVMDESDFEVVGHKVVIESKEDNFLNSRHFSPSFLTISPTGKMYKILDDLDWAKFEYKSIYDELSEDIWEDINQYKSDIKSLLERDKTSKDIKNDGINEIKKRIKKIPKILLLGESGVGKTLVAHYLTVGLNLGISDEDEVPFKRISIPDYSHNEHNFITNLFGYKGGSFSDSNPEGKVGILVENIGGVIFFDEIGEATPTIQDKLLTYFDNYEGKPYGENFSIFAPNLIVASTNRPLDAWSMEFKTDSKKTWEKDFRNDLFQRFDLVLHIPSLNERREEIPFVVDVFLQMDSFNPNGHIKKISKRALKTLQMGDYSNKNFRILERVVKRACRNAIKSGRKYIVTSDLEGITTIESDKKFLVDCSENVLIKKYENFDKLQKTVKEKGKKLEQIYLSEELGEMLIKECKFRPSISNIDQYRIRRTKHNKNEKSDTICGFCVKGKNDNKKVKEEFYISNSLFEKYKKLCKKTPLIKYRLLDNIDGRDIKIDYFDTYDNIIIAEVENIHESSVTEDFPPFGREITNNPEYSNLNIFNKIQNK